MNYTVWLLETPAGEFRKTEVTLPPLAPNQALIKISHAGVNPLDIKIRTGKAGHANQPLPAVLCVEMAGTVVEVRKGRNRLPARR